MLPNDSAGTPAVHLLIDYYGGRFLTDVDVLRAALVGAAQAAGATVLSCEMHKFGGAGGVTGVALLAESHISVHTWPEHELAVIDVFMCGAADPKRAAAFLEEALQPVQTQVTSVARGQRNQASQPSR